MQGLSNGRSGPWSPSWRVWECRAASTSPGARAQSGQLEDLPRSPRGYDQLLPDEVEAIKAFALSHPKVGYRKLSYQMLDQDVVAVSESAVYRVLRAADLLSRWKRSTRSKGQYLFKPTAPNQQQWQTDVMYVWVGCRHYFLLSFVDAYSRYVVHHRLLTELTGRAVATELEAAAPGVWEGPAAHRARPRERVLQRRAASSNQSARPAGHPDAGAASGIQRHRREV